MTFLNLCHKVYMEAGEKSQVMYDQVLEALRDEIQKALNANQTQEDIAHLCDVTQPTIQRILKGTRGQNLPLKTSKPG